MTQAARYALSLLRKAAGGAVSGPLHGTDGGRTDTLPISVAAGSYVVPSDVVSGMPGAQGNSLAGHAALEKLMRSLPLSPDASPYGVSTPKLKTARTMPGLVSEHRLAEKGLASGGKTDEHAHEPVPILAAAGEHVIPPEFVRRIGLGDLDRGHAILDKFCMEVRKKNIKDLRKLPKPARD